MGGDIRMNEWKRYEQWILMRLGVHNKTRYSKLFDFLHNTEFFCVMDRDINRIDDGLDLRNDYICSEKLKLENKYCSVLEVLAALAIRVDDEYLCTPGDERPDIFFFDMIRNLGLDRFDNGNFDERAVLDILDIWMTRDFLKSGIGSPFPVRHDKRDQRVFEIWDQMNHYIYERYSQ